MKSILQYPGSKWRIAKQIVSLLPPHHTYLEPYFGSGAVLFNKSRSDIETINDLGYDSDLYRNMLKDWHRIELEGRTQSHARRTEVIWTNYIPPQAEQLTFELD